MVALTRDMLDRAPACADGMQAGMSLCLAKPAVRLFVGAHGSNFAQLEGDRCFSAAHDANTVRVNVPGAVRALLDSGAFTDGPADRRTPAEALARQLDWERKGAFRWHAPHWQAAALVSYDRLIDETWIADTRHKTP